MCTYLGNKIDSLTMKVKKSNIKIGFQMLLLSLGICVVAKTVKDQQTEINELKSNLMGMVSEETEIAEVKMELEDMA